MLDLGKYRKVKFNEDKDFDKKVKTLLLLLDRESETLKLSKIDEVGLIDKWLLVFKEHKQYQMIEPFTIRKRILISKITKGIEDELTAEDYLEYKPKTYKIISFFKKLLKYFKK
mgnify:CR=1 FL=1|tara:strand:+ start:38955 stop:39296 length:342 start_codon:yes stop_codon:yes gene_type:complete